MRTRQSHGQGIDLAFVSRGSPDCTFDPGTENSRAPPATCDSRWLALPPRRRQQFCRGRCRWRVDGDEQCGAKGDADPAGLDTRTWPVDIRRAQVSAATNGLEPSGGARVWGDLVVAQLRGIAAWLDEVPDARQRMSREARLDRDRASQARGRERAALLAYLDQQDLAVMTGQPPFRRPMIVVAHRQPWWRDKVRDALDSAGLCVCSFWRKGRRSSRSWSRNSPRSSSPRTDSRR